MPRQIEYDDPSIHAGYGPNKDKQYRAKKGEQHIVRVLTQFTQYLVHAVDDVLPPKPSGEPGVFNMSCAQDWNKETEEWEGECRGHERDYDLKDRFVAGVLLLAKREGKSMMKLEPADSVRFWDMAKTMLLDLRQTADNAGKKLNQIELLLSLKQEEGAETMQKIKVEVWTGEQLTTKAHIDAFKEIGPPLIEECARPATLEEQDRRLKKKKPAATKTETTAKPEEQAGDELNLDLDGGGEAPKPAAAPRKPAAKAAPAPAPEPEATEEEAQAEEEPAPPPPPKKPATPKATSSPKPAAAKKPAPAPKATTEDAEVNDLLAGLESG